jgi:glucuronokinase
MIIESRAFARAGLLGNPSDGYFGKTISIIVRNFSASVSIYETPELVIEECEEDSNKYRSIYHLVDSVKLSGYYGGSRLIKAAIKKFTEYCEKAGINLPRRNFTIRFRTSIPRQIGMAGSSAIVTATMRALMKFYDVSIPTEILPGIILSAETDELGINAGLQDRVIQVYEGCVYMDFNKQHMEDHGHGFYENIQPSLLPKLYMAYKTELGKVSGPVFNNLKERYHAGDKLTVDTLAELASLAEDGKKAILNRDYVSLHSMINRNFDLRCKIMNISASNMELVNTARECGASAKFSGSGGAIIGMYEDDEMLQRLIIHLRKINARVIKPIIQ